MAGRGYRSPLICKRAGGLAGHVCRAWGMAGMGRRPVGLGHGWAWVNGHGHGHGRGRDPQKAPKPKAHGPWPVEGRRLRVWCML